MKFTAKVRQEIGYYVYLYLDPRTSKPFYLGKGKGNRGSVAEINTLFGAKPVVIREQSILINVNQTFRYGMSHIELYDATRAAWKLNPARAKNATLAFCVYLGVVRQVYRIKEWFEGGAIMRSTDPDGRHALSHDRWEFVGQVADERYVNDTWGDRLGTI